MRILALSSPPGQCGIGDYNATLCASLRSQGHHVDLIELRQAGDRVAPLRQFAAQIGGYDAAVIQHEFSFFGETLRVQFGNFADALSDLQRAGRPAVAFLHTDLTIPLKARPLFRPFSPAWRDRSERRRMIKTLNRTNLRVFMHSEASRAGCCSIGVDGSRIEAITFPMQPAPALVEPRPLSETDIVELTIFGFVSEYKGYEVALKALRLLPDNYVLNIAGQTHPFQPNDQTLNAIYGFLHTGEWVSPAELKPVPYMKRDFTEAERTALAKRVRVTGYLSPEQVAASMDGSDIVLLPYRLGPSGSAALGTALSFARPTIASAIPAFLNVARQSDCFRIVPIDAPYQLAETIRALAMNHAERQRMFHAVRGFAEANSFDALAQKCVRTLAELSGRDAGQRLAGHNESPLRSVATGSEAR